MTTRQEIYDTARKGLLGQMKKSRFGGDKCAYRGDNGLKCAIGHCIPDDSYNESLEGSLASHQEIMEAVGLEQNLSNIQFLRDLQEVHDYSSPEDWEEELDYFAERYNLNKDS